MTPDGSNPLDTDEARALREAVRDLLDDRSAPEAVREAMVSARGFDAELWSVLCGQIGVAGLAVPEEYGGAGATMAEVHVVLDELGRTLTPCPMLGSAVLGAQAVLAVGDDPACERLLPGIAAGETIAALVWTGEDGTWRPDAPAVTAEHEVLDGAAHYVLDGDIADVLLVAARTADGVGLFEVDPQAPGVRCVQTQALDQTRRLARVELSGVAAQRLGEGDYTPALRRVRDLGLVAVSAEQVGAARRALELTVAYTGQRKQFGRPIGGFQALKHRMADVHVANEAARSTSHAALRSALDDGDELFTDAVVAKVRCSDALRQSAAEMIQLHGGIAITWEHDAHLYFKRANGAAQLFGSPESYVSTLTPADVRWRHGAGDHAVIG